MRKLALTNKYKVHWVCKVFVFPLASKFETPPRVGDFVVFLKAGDQAFCRMKIEEMNSVSGKCLLYNIDLGSTLWAHVSKLIPMTKSLMKVRYIYIADSSHKHYRESC